MRTRSTICTVQPGAAGAPWSAAAIGGAAALAFAARRRRK
jgi:MYXO-CTERM domain-containing protein